MTVNDWAILVAVVMPISLAMAPWMFMVHAKLAVIAVKVGDLCDTIKKSNEQQLQLARAVNQHEARLDAIEQHIGQDKSETRNPTSETRKTLP